jgi:hypothetical protein
MQKYFNSSTINFLKCDVDAVIGRLVSIAADAGFHSQLHSQTDAWRLQIEVLQGALSCPALGGDLEHGWLLLEYPIPRRGKRIDAVLLAAGLVIVIEFKCGARDYARDAVSQVEDYGLDLRDFHKPSHGRTIVPILVATEAPTVPIPAPTTSDPVQPVWRANRQNLGERIAACVASLGVGAEPFALSSDWSEGEYLPTPTIIKAAQALYAGQNVREISRCHGGAENLTRTTEVVIEAVSRARDTGRKVICFITGVPGAGKTLAGLNIVHNQALHEKDLGVFLSGNGPLVRVLTEALARDHAERQEVALAESRRKVSTFIQNVHRFIDNYFSNPTLVPVDRVVIFDEAQRAWDADQSLRKFKRPYSEPEIMLDVMSRHDGWATVIALVGSGQEINRGEAGLSEWGRALASRFEHWDIMVAPGLVGSQGDGVTTLFEDSPGPNRVTVNEALQLSVSIRSYRAEALSEFVDALLSLQPERAQAVFDRISDYPLVLTRDLGRAKEWLRERQRGTRRIGLIASSGARRLRAHGLDVTAELDVENWLLNKPDDVRSSFYLEVPATEFGIQGLELDWTGLCWGGDLSPGSTDWVCRSFRGTRWQNINDPTNRRFTINKYRVLLTRAREGMVIWVPLGDERDHTRPPGVYQKIADYLMSCGIPELGSGPRVHARLPTRVSVAGGSAKAMPQAT